MGKGDALVPRPVSPKTVLVMVGLPARGKSHITRKVARYLTWLGYTAQVFNVGNYRRERLGEQKPQEFYDPNNADNTRARREIAMLTLREMLTWLRKGGDVGIYDATNTTRTRRDEVQKRCEDEGVHVVFIESLCDDEEIIEQNVRATKLGSPDYAGWDPDDAIRDFRERIAHYESVYEPLEDDTQSYVKLIDGGRKFVANRMDQALNQRVLFFLMNLRITAPTIWLTRHGESLHNVEGRIGGDADLSPLGEEYARRLAAFFADIRGQDENLTVWTSTMRRTMQTAAYMPEVPRTYRNLNEIDAGVCDGMTYEQIRRERPKEFAARAADKLRYRYPRGESYEDVIQRLDPRILDIERQQSPLLIIAHQAVLRTIYGYFLGRPPRECPNLSIPLHTVIKLVPNPYGCDEERIELGPFVPAAPLSQYPAE